MGGATRNRPSLRILMVAPTSFFSDYGGHIRIMEESAALQRLGHQVAIVTYFKGSDLPGLDIRRTARLPWRTYYEVGSSRHKVAYDALLAAKVLAEGVRVRPHIIHGHMHEGALIGGVVARLLRRPLVFDFQGSLTAEMVDHKFLRKGGLTHALLLRLERFISRRLPRVTLTSSGQARSLLIDSFGVRPERIIPLPDCADTRRFDPALFASGEGQAQKESLRRRLGLPRDALVAVYLGLLTDYQGVPHILEAAARLKASGGKLHFLLMGYPNVDHYRALARHKQVDDIVTLTGKVLFKDAPLYLSLGDVALAPKMSTSEGSGKLLNYMAMALPVVAYDTPVQREYLGELGVYAPPADVAGFTAALASLAGGEAGARAQLGAGLRARAKARYSWDAAGRLMSDLYYSLTAR